MKKQILINNLLATLMILLLICMISLRIHRFHYNQIIKAHIYKACTSNENAINQAIKDIDKGKKYILSQGLLYLNEGEIKERMKEEN